jgi:DNA polymerase I
MQRPVRVIHITDTAAPNSSPAPGRVTAVDWPEKQITHVESPAELDDSLLLDPTRPVVLFDVPAQAGSLLVCGKPLPALQIDLHAEYRNLINGRTEPPGGPEEILHDQHSRNPMQAILELWEAVEPHLRASQPFSQALFRGSYAQSVARMERRGIPIDFELLNWIRENRPRICRVLAADTEAKNGYGLNLDELISRSWLESFVERNGLDWPRAGAKRNCSMTSESFKTMTAHHPGLSDLYVLKTQLDKLRNFSLRIDSDGRHRFSIRPFSTLTGRNQPRVNSCLMQQAKWMRNVIRPDRGWALAYLDWKQQEFGIAAALSRDPAMMRAYHSGDPYLDFAKLSQAVPPDATAESHPRERKIYKEGLIGIQYGMGAKRLAARAEITPNEAADLLRHHHTLFSTYWEWQERVCNSASLNGTLTNALGWTRRTRNDRRNTVANYPVQSNGAALLQLAAVEASERGIGICCPVHDAFLIEVPEETLEQDIGVMQQCMQNASETLLNGFTLETQTTRIIGEGPPDPEPIWHQIMDVLNSDLDA